MSSTNKKKPVSRLLQTNDCHIGIIGSGLAGLSCALAIRSSPSFQGRITIYERKPNNNIEQTTSNDNDCNKKEEVAEGHGYGMTITYNPDGPLAKLGVLESVAKEDCPSRCHYIFDNEGYIRGYFGNAFYKQDDNNDGKSSSRGAGQRGNLRIPRARLRSILFDALMSEAEKVEAKNMNTYGNTNTSHDEQVEANTDESIAVVENENDESSTTTTSSPRGMVKVLWNKKLTSYEDTLMMEKLNQITSSGKRNDNKNTTQQQMKNQDDKAVTLHFEDGSIDQVDLLIGADGVNSSVARQYLSTTIPSKIPLKQQEEMISSSNPRHLGIFLILGISNHFHSHINERGFYTLDGTHRLFIMPFQGSVLTDDDDDDTNVDQIKKRRRRTMWQLSFPVSIDRNSEEVLRLKQMSQEEMQQEVLSRIGDWHNPVPNLVKDTPLSSIWGTSLLDRDPTVFIEQRSKLEVHGRIPSRVVLVGDAAHSMSPFKGQGANQALADGPLLASWLTKSKPDSAVRGFMTEMTRRSGVKVRASRESAQRLHNKDSCWQWMFQQETKQVGDSSTIQAVFHGVQPHNVTLLLQTLKDQRVTASLGSKLDDAIRVIINQLNISETTLPQNPEVINKDNHQEITQLQSQALEYASTGNISKLRELSLKSHLIIPTALDDSKRSCIHLAALNNHTDVCRWLLSEVNINCNLLDVDGQRAIDLAVNAGNEDTIQLLKRWMKQGDTATPSTSTNQNKDNPSNDGETDDLYRHVEQQLRGIRSMKQLKALLEKNRDSATSTDHIVTHVLGCKVDHSDLEYEKQCTKALAEEHGAVLLRNFISREVDQVALAALALRPLSFDVSDALDRLRVEVDNDEYFDTMKKIGSRKELIPKSKQKHIGKCVEDIKTQLTIPSDHDIIVQTNFFPELKSHASNENQAKKRKIDSFPLSRYRYINLGEMNYNWGDRCYEKVPNADKLPGRLVSLAQHAHKIAQKQTNEVSTSPVSFDMAICNMYHLSRPSDRLGGHRDNVELDVSLPLVTISMGAPGIFLLGGKTRGDCPTPILLRSGDCLILSGKSRRYYHGVPTILTNEPVDDDSDNIPNTTESYCVFPELQSNGYLDNDINNNSDISIPSSDELKFAKVFLSSVRMNMSIRRVSS